MINVKLGGKLKAWLKDSLDVHRVNQHLPQGVRASRGKRGHVAVRADGLGYEFERSRFGSAEELAAYAASKIPGGGR
jgi:hypothetical protein